MNDAIRPLKGALPQSTGLSLLLVDDDDAFRDRLAKAFVRRGHSVRGLRCGKDAALAVQTTRFDRAVVDLRMPGEWGLNVVRELLAAQSDLRVVVLTAYGSIATALEAVRIGAVHFLQKPATVEEIEHALALSPVPIAPSPAQDPTMGVHAECAEPPQQVPTLARAEWELINRVLTECQGNIRRAAELLGVHRRTLQRKLAKFPVSR